MILYNHPAEKVLGRILAYLRPPEHSHPPPVKVLTMNRDSSCFSFFNQRSKDTWTKKVEILNA